MGVTFPRTPAWDRISSKLRFDSSESVHAGPPLRRGIEASPRNSSGSKTAGGRCWAAKLSFREMRSQIAVGNECKRDFQRGSDANCEETHRTGHEVPQKRKTSNPRRGL
jgi:hypothetical protein